MYTVGTPRACTCAVGVVLEDGITESIIGVE
jgi:hypothetical protein